MRAECRRGIGAAAIKRWFGVLIAVAAAFGAYSHAASAHTSWYAQCPSGNAAITNSTLTAVQGGTATGTFKIAAGCKNIQVSLASYDAPAFTFALPQTLIDSKTGYFNAGGPYSFTVNVSPCFYQVDLVRGAVIVNLTSTNLYGDRKLQYANGGTKCASKIGTTASAAVDIGGAISDSALLSGLSAGGGGTITFKAYGPDDTNCSKAAAFTSAAIPVSGSNTYSSGSFTPTAAGTYRWTASYTGDSHNAAVSSGCNDANESVLVQKKTPTLATVASANAVIGAAISDTATLSGATSAAGGTITFKLYGPDDATCGAAAIFTSTVNVSGNGNYPSGSFTPGAVGAYRWVASYSGDAKNATIAGSCNLPNEAVTIAKAGPSLVTLVASASVKFGTAIGDSATLSGATANAGGSITFKAYGPADTTCTGAPVFTSAAVPVSGNGTYPSGTFTPAGAGTYRFIAAYTGDAGNAAFTTSCNDANEAVVVGEQDHTPPACVLSHIVPGPPKQLQITVQDSESGIASIAVDQISNATASIPPFSSGTTGTLLVTATKTDQTKSSFIRIKVTNTAGLTQYCDPIVPASKAKRAAAATHKTAGLALTVNQRRAVYGSDAGVLLSGHVPGARAGTVVALTSRACGFDSANRAATAKTKADGSFALRLQPGLTTTYALTWQGSTRTVRVTVQPQVTLTRESAGRYRIDVLTTNGLFLDGAHVALERWAGGRWITARTALLVKNSSPDEVSVTSSGWFGASLYGTKLRARVGSTACYAGGTSPTIKG